MVLCYGTDYKSSQIHCKNSFGTSTFGKLPEAWQERPGVVALFRMAKNGVGRGLLVSRKALISLSKSIPHLMYPKDKTNIRKFNFGCTFFTKLSNQREWTNESVTYSLGEHTIKWYADGSKTHKRTGAGVCLF